jgi:tRNA(adenine34) deaminase
MASGEASSCRGRGAASGDRRDGGFDRRGLLVGFVGSGLAAAALAAAPADAKFVDAPVAPDDERFMRMAIEEASRGDYPFGAVIVGGGEVLARGRNLGRTLNDPTAHGEMVAIRRFLAVRPAAELRGTTLYTSGEPCAMCMSAIIWCGIGRLVFAASVEQIAAKMDQIMLTSREIAAKSPFSSIGITGGVLADKAVALFR